MSIISTNIKELLARFASGQLEEIPESVLTPELERVVQDVYKAKQELHKPNVLSTVHKMHPEFVNPVISEDITDSDLIYIVENESYKNFLIEFDLKLTDALVRQKDNPLFDWYALTNELSQILKPKSAKDLVYLDEISFDSDRVIASWGLPTLDYYLEGGVSESSFSIFYAASGVGKTQAVTIDMSVRLLKQGKTPLIISLEGSPRKLATKIVATMAGLADVDAKDYTEADKNKILEISRQLPHIPIINKGCRKKWEIDKLIQQYKADIVIYDQLTISGNGRDWESMAAICEVLKQISIGSGIPVIALTQSSSKNYNSGGGDEEELHTENYIKYSQAVFEDATHVVEIGKHDNSNMRSFTIRKTKDDKTAKILPVRLILELGSYGYVEKYVRDYKGKKIELSEIKQANPVQKIEKPIVAPVVPPTKPALFNISPVIQEIKIKGESDTEIKTEVGSLPNVVENGGLFSNEAWLSTPNRLRFLGLDSVASSFEFNLPNMPQYGDTSNPEFLLKITSNEIPEAFLSFYD